jgi:hypothetical protein
MCWNKIEYCFNDFIFIVACAQAHVSSLTMKKENEDWAGVTPIFCSLAKIMATLLIVYA